ncbi:MAG: hypothetical protein AAF202_11465, partial [Pseudomonadota bacterium]
RQILSKKMSATPSEIGSNRSKIDAHFREPTSFYPSETLKFEFSLSQSQAFRGYHSQQKSTHRQKVDETAASHSTETKTNKSSNHPAGFEIQDQSPKEFVISASELSAIGSVAFRTLRKLSDSALPSELSESSLLKLKRTLSKSLHPDLGGSPEAFMEMLEAISLLHEELRSALDMKSAA